MVKSRSLFTKKMSYKAGHAIEIDNSLFINSKQEFFKKNLLLNVKVTRIQSRKKEIYLKIQVYNNITS